MIGAGMSGLCAIKLREARFEFAVFEKNDAVGGTWYENKYPGGSVDTPIHFYSNSFEPGHHRTEFYSKRDELHAYFERCADKYDVRRALRFDAEVQETRFDEQRQCWPLTVRDGKGGVETQEFGAVHSRHFHVGDNHVDGIRGHEGERLCSALRELHVPDGALRT